MKKMIPLLLLPVLLTGSVAAQVCGNPQAQIDLFGNNIKARILNGGDLFWNFSKGQFIPNPDGQGNGPSTIFNAGLWLGGVDPGGNLKLSAVTYRNVGATDFFTGPLSYNDGTIKVEDCANWDRFFRVRGERVAAFLDSLPLLVNDPGQAKIQFPDILGWPGAGNPFFADLTGFDLPFSPYGVAPFFDADQDGQYNPLQGDYPVVQLRNFPPFVPEEMVWCVFNDQGAGAIHMATNGKAFPVEVQLMAWAFNCSDQPVLNNTIFTSHKMIFHTSDPVDSSFVGMWIDFDLGCYEDDYVGCSPASNAVYVYNQDAVDGNPGNTCSGGVSTFSNPPVQSATFLNQSLDKFIPISNGSSNNPPSGTTDPNNPNEYYNYMTGHWRDGNPITVGGSGYNSSSTETNFAFPDNPADPNGWSMCTANLPFGDRRVLAIHGFDELLPGQVEELNMAWTVHPDPALPCGLGTALDDIETLHLLYDSHFSGVCLPVLGAREPVGAGSLKILPNPTSGQVRICYPDLHAEEIRCFDAMGRLVAQRREALQGQCILDLTPMPVGIYQLQILAREGIATRSIVVER